jgi:general secretion pathway protein I
MKYFCPICNLKFAIYNLQSKKRKAFSILEVILALAILTGAMAVLGELGRLGFRNAKSAQDLTKAQMLCESKMAEYTAGITTPQSVSATPFDAVDQDSSNSTTWIYSVDMQQIDQYGLDALCVTVTQNLPAAQQPASYSITRWIVDPSVAQAAAAAATSTEESTTGTSGSTQSSATGATGTGSN